MLKRTQSEAEIVAAALYDIAVAIRELTDALNGQEDETYGDVPRQGHTYLDGTPIK
jgi:hypothetical protein